LYGRAGNIRRGLEWNRIILGVGNPIPGKQSWPPLRIRVMEGNPRREMARRVSWRSEHRSSNVMIRVTRKVEFSAAHFYHNPSLSAEENRRVFGKCNNPHGHGHNYVLEVTVAGEPDPATGMVLDLKELKDILQREVVDRMDHRHLNYEVPELAGKIPTCENVALAIWHLLLPKITRGKLDRVRLYESPDLFADCTSDRRGDGATPEAGVRG
jgi:6-pyruvoyltetrahydropterin/6-carboxytetrahydropterin synthase